jgi:hypothetical protein
MGPGVYFERTLNSGIEETRCSSGDKSQWEMDKRRKPLQAEADDRTAAKFPNEPCNRAA